MADRKKVLWLIRCLGPGGAEKLLSMSLPYLDREAFDYQVAYFLGSKNYLVPEFERAGVPVFCLDAETPYDLRAAFRLARLLKKRRIDILHVHSPYWGIWGRLAGRLAGVKAVVSTEHQFPEKLNPLTRLGSLLTYPLNRATIGVSEAMSRSLAGQRTVRKETLYTIQNGIDLNAIAAARAESASVRKSLGIEERRPVIGNVAHIRPLKGHQYLLEAAPLIVKQCPEAMFVIVGREQVKGELKRLEELAERLGVRRNVIFAGFRPDALRIMAACDVFVLPSLSESFGIVLLEAMALGKPVVASRVGGIPEVFQDGVQGFLVEPRNPRHLAEKTLELLQDAGLRDRMGQQGIRRVRDKFDIRHTVEAVEGVYASVLNGHGRQAR